MRRSGTMARLVLTYSRLQAFIQPERLHNLLLCNQLWAQNIHRFSCGSRFCSTSDDIRNNEELEIYEGPIPRDKLSITFSKSSGPGGQHVNKDMSHSLDRAAGRERLVNTKVEVRFHVDSADWLPGRVKGRLKTMFKNRINKTGELFISSQRYRSQTNNLKDAINKLEQFLQEASEVPKGPSELTLARIKILKRKSERQRLVEKKYHSSRKDGRRTDDL